MKTFSRRQFLAVAACAASLPVAVFVGNRKPTQRVRNEKLVCAIWETARDNKPLSEEMLRNINAVDDDDGTALHIAAYNADPRAMRILLDNGIDPSVRDHWDETVEYVLRMNLNENPEDMIQDCLQVLYRC